MAGTVVVQAKVEEDLTEEEQTEVKEAVEKNLAQIDKLGSPEVFYKQETGTRAIGFAVDETLDKLAGEPGEGRYLAIFIFDEEGEIISEKFILNPALKMDKGRFGMAMSILQRNGVGRVLLPGPASRQQKVVLKELGLKHREVDVKTLAELRDKTVDITANRD